MSSLCVECVSDFQMRGSKPARQICSAPVTSFAADLRGVRWFALTCPPTGLTERLDWDSIHVGIQEGLERLTQLVLAKSPQAAWKSGRNAARALPLLSYRVFYRSDGDDYDPVIASVAITLEGPVARVSGDISGDETGRIYFDEGCELEVPPHQEAILASATLVASRLAAQPQIVLDAMNNRDFQITQR